MRGAVNGGSAIVVQADSILNTAQDFRGKKIATPQFGNTQDVAARALAPDPRVLLMDEPFASLDDITREHLYGDLQDIWQKRLQTIIFVTHNVREAVCLGDRVYLLSPSPGRIREDFKITLSRPRDFNSPELAAIAQRITLTLKNYLVESREAAE